MCAGDTCARPVDQGAITFVYVDGYVGDISPWVKGYRLLILKKAMGIQGGVR